MAEASGERRSFVPLVMWRFEAGTNEAMFSADPRLATARSGSLARPRREPAIRPLAFPLVRALLLILAGFARFVFLADGLVALPSAITAARCRGPNIQREGDQVARTQSPRR